MSFDYKTYFLSDLSKHFETCPACEYNQASVANGFLFPFQKLLVPLQSNFISSFLEMELSASIVPEYMYYTLFLDRYIIFTKLFLF